MNTAAEIEELCAYLTPDEMAQLNALLDGEDAWTPLEGPQSMAYYSEADEVGYGGAAGGGKTDLMLGLALTRHVRSIVFRKYGTEHAALIDRMTELLGSRDSFNGKDNAWVLPDARKIELGSMPNLGDEVKYQGRPHDLLAFDEATNMPLPAMRFLKTWLRSVAGVRCKMLFTFNPPVTAEGRWVIDYFAPWLDPKHPNPADPGELRWFATVAGKDIEVADNRKFVLVGDHRVYDFDESKYGDDEIIEPTSRTFIPARVTDNPYLSKSGYMKVLQSLPEPLRSQMLYGDFTAGMSDDPWQVIPTEWVEAAQARWKPQDESTPPMDSLGVDVARGGRDKTVIAPRHGNWYAPLLTYPGKDTPDGPAVAGLAVSAKRNGAVVHIDVIGVGASPYDFLRAANQQVIGVNVSEASEETDKSGALHFANMRSALWWKLREDLDPANGKFIALPPDRELLADLCAPKWKLRGMAIQVESRDEIIDRIGRSPDKGTAVVLARLDTPKVEEMRARVDESETYHPFATHLLRPGR